MNPRRPYRLYEGPLGLPALDFDDLVLVDPHALQVVAQVESGHVPEQPGVWRVGQKLKKRNELFRLQCSQQVLPPELGTCGFCLFYIYFKKALYLSYSISDFDRVGLFSILLGLTRAEHLAHKSFKKRNITFQIKTSSAQL